MPSGLSLTDIAFIAFTTLAIIFLTSTSTIYGAICTYWILFLSDGFLNKKWWQTKPENFNPISQLPKFAQSGWAGFSFFMFLYMGYLLYRIEINDNTMIFLLSLAVLGFLFSCAVLVNNDNEKNTPPRKFIIPVILVIAVLMIIFVTALSKGEILSIAMRSIGIRYDNVSIETTTENIKSVKALSQTFKFDIETCHLT